MEKIRKNVLYLIYNKLNSYESTKDESKRLKLKMLIKLTDLIKTKHNSNYKIKQLILKGEIIQEYTYYVLGFVPADVVRLKKDAWFSKLSSEQITLVEKYLQKFNY